MFGLNPKFITIWEIKCSMFTDIIKNVKQCHVILNNMWQYFVTPFCEVKSITENKIQTDETTGKKCILSSNVKGWGGQGWGIGINLASSKLICSYPNSYPKIDPPLLVLWWQKVHLLHVKFPKGNIIFSQGFPFMFNKKQEEVCWDEPCAAKICFK